jgi:hypothetical protein
MIRLGTSADLPAASGVYRIASLHNEGDRENLLAHPEYLILGPDGLAEGRTTTTLVRHLTAVLRARGIQRVEVSANLHALAFYHSAGFTECGVVQTDFYPAPRMALDIG